MSSVSSFFTSWYRSPFVVTTWLPWYRTSFFGAWIEKQNEMNKWNWNFITRSRFDNATLSITKRGLHLLGRQDGVFCYHPHCPPACTYGYETIIKHWNKEKEDSSDLHRIIAVLLTFQGCSLSVFGLPARKYSSHGLPDPRDHKKKLDFWNAQCGKLLTWNTVAAIVCVAETHIKRRGAELDIALNDKAHSFLHVSFGNRQGTASLRQTTLRKHLQQVLLLSLPPRHWWLDIHMYTVILDGCKCCVRNEFKNQESQEQKNVVMCAEIITLAVAPSVCVLRQCVSLLGGCSLGRVVAFSDISFDTDLGMTFSSFAKQGAYKWSSVQMQ